MSLPLTPEEDARYTSIIDAILATADLNTVTRKKIRQGLERALGGKDLGPQKNAIKALIEARFDAISGASQDQQPHSPDHHTEDPGTHSPHLKRPSNGHSVDVKTGYSPTPDDEDGSASPDTADEPARKKVKRDPSIDDDAKLAAELQAQEDRMSRGRRATRGAGNGGVAGDAGKKKKKAAPKKKVKSEKKIAGEGESEGESGDEGNGATKKKGGGFQKPFNLSYPLAEICGESQLSRPQVVKRLWDHIKGNGLQDPEDKRQILCDDKLIAVFKQTRVSMFGMNKLISSHLYPVEEE